MILFAFGGNYSEFNFAIRRPRHTRLGIAASKCPRHRPTTAHPNSAAQRRTIRRRSIGAPPQLCRHIGPLPPPLRDHSDLARRPRRGRTRHARQRLCHRILRAPRPAGRLHPGHRTARIADWPSGRRFPGLPDWPGWLERDQGRAGQTKTRSPKETTKSYARLGSYAGCLAFRRPHMKCNPR